MTTYINDKSKAMQSNNDLSPTSIYKSIQNRIDTSLYCLLSYINTTKLDVSLYQDLQLLEEILDMTANFAGHSNGVRLHAQIMFDDMHI